MFVKHLATRLHPHHTLLPLMLACLGLVLTALAAFAPASPSPTVWVAQDATNAMQCTTRTTLHATTARAVTTTTQPCAAGTILRLVTIPMATARAHQQAYVTTPTGPAAQALLHPTRTTTTVAGAHPTVICTVAVACGGGGGGGAPCEQQSKWISFNTSNVVMQGWYSTYGTSDCQAFEVYSEGLEQTWSRPLWAWFSWHTVWQTDNGAYLHVTIPTNSYLTRTPNYWIGAGGANEQFYENNGYATNYFSVQFTPR